MPPEFPAETPKMSGLNTLNTPPCVDIDIDDVDDSQSIYYVVVVIVNHSLLQAILFVSKW